MQKILNKQIHLEREMKICGVKRSFTSLGMFYVGLHARLTVIKPVLLHNKTVIRHLDA